MKPEAERFWAKVEKTETCWLWTAGAGAGGYGHFWINRDGKKTMVRAHRWSYEQLVGPIPDGLQLDHVKTRGCVSTLCVRPDHLEPVTNRENSLRGDSPNVITWRTNRCQRGHSMHDAYIVPNGYRQCRSCRRDGRRRYYLTHEAAGQS